MDDNCKRVTVNCRMSCNEGLIPAFHSNDQPLRCPEIRCPYNRYGERFHNWTIEQIDNGIAEQDMTEDDLRLSVRTLRKGLRRIAAMAGTPDAAIGCRNIIAECNVLLSNIRD